MKRLLSLLPILFFATGCDQAPPSADPSVITSRSDAWEAGLNAKDVDAIVALYTSDARILPPNGKMAEGRDAVRAEFGAMIDAGLGGELSNIETMVAGDIAYNVGTYKLMAADELVDVGKFIEIWHRGGDGQWLMANDIWNSDLKAQSGNMSKTHLMISHEVDDVDKWLQAWRGEDSRHKLFKENGAAHVHTFRSPSNPNLTGLVVAVEDMGALQSMLESEQGLAAAAEDGVRRDTLEVLTEAE